MSGRQFSKVSPAVWRSSRFAGLESSDAKLLYLYFLTCEHQNSAGTYRIPDGYASTDLGWELKRYRDARTSLIEVELIAFDPACSTVYIERWFQHNPPMNDKHAQGTLRQIDEIESESILAKAMADFEQADKSRRPVQPASHSPMPFTAPSNRYLKGGR